MTWFDFSTVVIDVTPGAVRARRDTSITAVHADTLAAVNLRQDGNVVPALTSDPDGVLEFEAENAEAVILTVLGQSLIVESNQQKVAKATFLGDLDDATDAAIDRAETAGRLITPAAVATTYARKDTVPAAYASASSLATTHALVTGKADANAVPLLAETGSASVVLGDIPVQPAVTSRNLWAAPYPCRITYLSVSVLTAITASGTDYWTVTFLRTRAGTGVSFAIKDTRPLATASEPLGANTAWTYDAITLTAEKDFAKDDLLRVRFNPTGAPAQLLGLMIAFRAEPL